MRPGLEYVLDIGHPDQDAQGNRHRRGQNRPPDPENNAESHDCQQVDHRRQRHRPALQQRLGHIALDGKRNRVYGRGIKGQGRADAERQQQAKEEEAAGPI